MKNDWLYYVGLIGVVITVLVTFTSFTNVTIDLQIPFLLLGELLSLCAVGLGKIITIMKKREKNEETKF